MILHFTDAWLLHFFEAWLRRYQLGWEQTESPGHRRTACHLLYWGGERWSYGPHWLRSFWLSSPLHLDRNRQRRKRVSFINEYDHAEYEEGFIECIKTDRSHYKVLKKAKRIFEYANWSILQIIMLICHCWQASLSCPVSGNITAWKSFVCFHVAKRIFKKKMDWIYLREIML